MTQLCLYCKGIVCANLIQIYNKRLSGSTHLTRFDSCFKFTHFLPASQLALNHRYFLVYLLINHLFYYVWVNEWAMLRVKTDNSEYESGSVDQQHFVTYMIATVLLFHL